MEWLNDIKRKFHRFSLQRQMKASKAKREIINLHNAKTVGIIYDATFPENNVLITRLAELIKRKEKTVVTIGFVNDTKTESNYGNLLFNRKSLNWHMEPSNDTVKKFINQKFDILINAFIGENLPLEYISALSKAKFRVGQYQKGKVYCYELMINTGKREDLQYLIDQISHFLNVIKDEQTV